MSRSNLISRLALNLLILPYDLAAYLADLTARLQKRDQIIFGEKEGALPQAPSSRRIAIVAAYPNQHSLPFLGNLLDGLAAHEFFILVVAGEKLAPAYHDFIRPRSHRIIEKDTVGRDFGSYKTGWQWVIKHRNLDTLDEVAFANDSLYWPRPIGSTIGEMLTRPGDWLCLFENFQTYYHAQSFFQIFRRPVFTSGVFRSFWQRYASPSARQRVITKGEVALTRCLTRAGFESHAYYNAAKLRADILAALDNKDVSEPFADVLNLTLGFEHRKLTGRPLPRREDFLALLPAAVAHKVGMLAEHYNPTHATGLLCNYLYQAPLKRDICYRNIHAMSDLVALAQGFSPEEKEAMFLDLRRKGAPAKFDGIRKIPQRLLWKAGRI
jgi:hypothetical protein